jgi:hypothetical protein
MKTLLLPLDERPCNRLFPQLISQSSHNIELLVPDKSVLGDKKRPADTAMISQFLRDHVHDCTNVIISVDTLVYGGLIPSRLHYLTKEEAFQRLEVLKELKSLNNNVKIYAFNCIMRTPQYDSSDEEPDYYAEHGFALFRRKYLLDYQERHGLSEAEITELAAIDVPEDVIADYEKRRDFNTDVNLEVIDYLGRGIIDFLVIPQDDSSPYGYTALSQKRVTHAIQEKKLDFKAMVYPGADEVALSLLTRAYHEFCGFEPTFYPYYASVLGPTIVPLYEDRPMAESLKAHLRVCRAKLALHPDKADFILAINSPGRAVQDTYDEAFDISYGSYRNLLDFCYQIRDFIAAGKKVALCDSAFCNGGDFQLIRYLDELDVLDKLCSYAGWNTNCNSLGTVLAQACFGSNLPNLLYRIIEDVCYQADVRHDIINHDLEKLGVKDDDVAAKLGEVEALIKEKLERCYSSLKISKKHPVKIKDVYLPWQRMFEIGMEIEADSTFTYVQRSIATRL